MQENQNLETFPKSPLQRSHSRTESRMAGPQRYTQAGLIEKSIEITEKIGKEANKTSAFTKNYTIEDINFRHMFKKFQGRLKQLIVPVHYDQDIKEQWQKDGNYQSKSLENGRYLFVKLSKIYFLIELSLFLVNVLMIWFVSVQSVYGTEDNSVLPVLWQIMAVLDIFITVNTTRIQDGREVKNRWGILKMYVKGEMFVDILCIVGIVLLTAADQDLKSIIYLVLMSVLVVKASAKYSNIKPFLDHNFAKEHITLVTSFAFLIAMGHIFGLIMYLVGVGANSQKNWIIAIKIQNEDWITKYIFSIYWAFTTMVTVGYGDITPQNKYEAVVVIVVQILATSIFGYMINIIGMTLTELKSRNEALETQLTITDKISKCFKIEDDLTYRIKSFLKNNHKVDSSFSLIEQTKLIDKLNPVLKRQLLEQTNTKIIKKSIFFLTHFTKSFQNKISVKLIKRVLQPSQPIAKIAGEQALYIVNSGSIDLSVFRCHKSRVYSKKVRTISSASTQQNGISLNVYGYTQLILGRMVNINATSNTFTIAYQLKRKDFLEILSTCMNDYEAVCQLKEKFFAKDILESVQAPQLADTRQHYYPHNYMLQRKNRVSVLQIRKNIRRRYKKLFRKACTNYKQGDEMMVKQAMTFSLSKRRYSDQAENHSIAVQGCAEQLMNNFQSVKSYSKYMVNCNIEKVIKKQQRLKTKKTDCFIQIANLMFNV